MADEQYLKDIFRNRTKDLIDVSGPSADSSTVHWSLLRNALSKDVCEEDILTEGKQMSPDHSCVHSLPTYAAHSGDMFTETCGDDVDACWCVLILCFEKTRLFLPGELELILRLNHEWLNL